VPQFSGVQRRLSVRTWTAGVDADELGGLSPDGARDLLGFARALTGDRGLAEDIVQDVVIRLITRTGPRIENVEAYARRMTVNAFISWRRKWLRVLPVGVVDDGAVAPDHAEHHSNVEDLRQRLERLPRRQRVAIVMRYLTDNTDAEIGDALGCSPSTARSLISRALASLRHEHALSRTDEEDLR
jgi:RNA polymerase sigma factor (sigma-70 family)